MTRKIGRILLTFFLVIACFIWSESASYATTSGPDANGWYFASGSPFTSGWNLGFGGSTATTPISIAVTISHNTAGPTAVAPATHSWYMIRMTCPSGSTPANLQGFLGQADGNTISTTFNVSKVSGQCPDLDAGQMKVEFGWCSNNTSPSTWAGCSSGAPAVMSVAYYQKGAPAVPPPPTVAGACVLTTAQLAEVARGAGFTDSNGPTAVAIAIAESSARVGAIHGPNADGSYDIGLWQINDNAHPTYDRNRLRAEPTYNAQAALAIWTAATNSFSPWVTYNSGAYLSNMDKARSAWVNTAPATIISSSCNGLTADPSGTTVTDANDSTDNCGFSVNPVTWMKCLFVPTSGSMQGWSSHVDSIKANPPASLVSSGYSYANNFIDQARCGDPDFNTIGNCHLEDLRFNTTLQGHNILFDPLGGAESVSSSTRAQVVRTFVIIALWGWFGFWAWHRVADSLGAKAKSI